MFSLCFFCLVAVCVLFVIFFFFFSSRRRHTRSLCDWSSDVCSSDLIYPCPPRICTARSEAYLASTGAADMAMMVTDRAVQILGGHGYIREHPVEMWMRNGRGFVMFTGLAIV